MLLQHQPEATTELLIDLCSGNLGRKSTHVHPPTNGTVATKTDGSSGPAVLSYLGYNRVTGFLTGGDNQSTTTNGDRGAAKAAAGGQANGKVAAGEIPPTDAEKTEDTGPSYTPPSPQQYFAHFLDHSPMFVHFLESVALSLWDQRVETAPSSRDQPLPIREEPVPEYDPDPVKQDQRAVWNTLLELYLSATRTNDNAIAKEASDKALGLLADPGLPYDPMHALILCSSADFKEGLVRLWESMGKYEDVLRFYMDKSREQVNGNGDGEKKQMNGTTSSASPSGEVIRYLNLYGPTNPHLYPLVLRYLTSSHDILSRHSDQLADILTTIDEERIMPPLAVVQLLSRNGVTSVGSVKQWLKQKTEDTRDDIESVSPGPMTPAVGGSYAPQALTIPQDRNLTESYRSETATKEKEIKDLSDASQPEVFQVTRCAACGGQLDLPSVHFMCKHSYHQRSVLLLLSRMFAIVLC